MLSLRGIGLGSLALQGDEQDVHSRAAFLAEGEPGLGHIHMPVHSVSRRLASNLSSDCILTGLRRSSGRSSLAAFLADVRKAGSHHVESSFPSRNGEEDEELEEAVDSIAALARSAKTEEQARFFEDQAATLKSISERADRIAFTAICFTALTVVIDVGANIVDALTVKRQLTQTEDQATQVIHAPR
eukprot:TRINITY_DN60689_c0_g1_i1.p1 TRINITY_DN60689_c0_g1~~TRINITY_DN60689_c0_g1_i1.p1  ORF type:complete len:187 (+),score=25.07 TRINITY_DN60689_c0_g1_i1:64-624(+)